MSSSQAKKRFALRVFRSPVNPPTKSNTEIEETLRSDHFHICKTVRHGFPFQPSAVAFDPVQHILAIGNKTGSLRIIGRPGVDIHILHDGEVAILQVLFLINEGALVTVCSDDTLHLWNFRQKKPEIVHSLKFQKERITYCHLPFQSKWLYIGTERGNVYIVNIESFILSGYIIYWNKAIELSRTTHPGPVVHLSDNPVDNNKLLIGFESGAIVMWDLRSKTAEYRYNAAEALRSIAWHFEGKQFMCSHSDGSLTTWNVKTPQKPANILVPHAVLGAEGKPGPCKPISRVAWNSVRNGEDMVIFSGGMSYDRVGRTPSITVMTGKSTTVLGMEHSVIDFVVLCGTPWCHDFQDPYAIIVLLQNDLVVVDLTTPGYPCFENPYPMDLHESPVTACQYYANCPTDLIPAFYSVGSRQKKTGFSEKAWPIKGGQWGSTAVSYPEIIITGHADGSLKFWDASSVSLQILYKVKTAKIFDKPRRSAESQDDDPFAIQIIFLCPESRMLCVAAASHVVLFRYSKQELTLEVPSLEFSIVYEIFDELDSPEFEFPTLPKPTLAVATQHSSSMGSYSSSTSDNVKTSEQMTAVKVRGGARKWAAGYQPDLVCVLCYVEGEPPGNITVLSLNSSYGLMAFGNDSGLAIVDFVQKTCLLNLGTPELYGSMDPYQRTPRSPRSKKSQSESVNPGSEEGKSPTADSERNDSSSFSRSRSSSISSLDNVNKEAIQCLVFADSYTRKTDSLTCPCLWVGTSLGSVIVICLNLPSQTGDQRTVIVSPSGTIFRLKGAIVGMSFLDCNGILIQSVYDQWKDSNTGVGSRGGSSSNLLSCGQEKDNRDDRTSKATRQTSVSTKPKISPTSSQELTDRQFVIICSEKQARVVSLPSQTCAYKVKITETSFVVRAEIVSLRDSVCLMCYIANGHIMAFSLPSLKPLFDEDSLPLTDFRMARTFCFSNNGHALYLCSPTEVQKITYSADIADNLSEMLGDLFLPCDTPEAPKQGFFKNLFGGGASVLDREELFGETSGRASKGLAKLIPGTGGVKNLQQQAGAVGGEINRTRLLMVKRGEKLGELNDSSERMRSDAENFAQATTQLTQRYRDKKWYQF